MKRLSKSDLIKEVNSLTAQNEQLQDQLNNILQQDKTIYKQVNSLLLWKGALKVRINAACPDPALVGVEGYLCDLFLDGWTVVVYGDKDNSGNWTNNEFYRLDANYLDVISWDTEKFMESMKVLGYLQHEGQWIHQDKLLELKK
jgi:hypothetical protein